jgi:chromosome segregation ATPase
MNEESVQPAASVIQSVAVTDREEVIAEPPANAALPSKRKTTRRLPAPPKESPVKEPESLTDFLLHQAQALLQTKQAELAQRQAEIAQRQAETDLLQRLIEIAQHKESQQPDLKLQLEDAQQQISGLQSANTQLQAQVERVERELAKGTKGLGQLRDENEQLRAEVGAGKAARLEEQQQFKEQIEREIKYEVEGFKGQLAGKLKPVFEQKSTTDGQSADAELAEFLRGWFQDLEEKLAAAGVLVSRRKP